MFLPLFPLKKLAIYGLDESNLGADAAAVAKSMAIIPLADIEPQRMRLSVVINTASSAAAFLRLTLKVGFDAGSPEQLAVNEWRKKRYHAPSDDLAQPVDKGAAGTFDTLVAKLLEIVANKNSLRSGAMRRSSRASRISTER